MLMNNLLTKKAIQANKTSRRNTLSFVLFVATLFSSSSAFANRPAMEESSEVSHEVSHEVSNAVEEAASSRPEVLSEDQQAGPSSVDIMMQQQNQQIYTKQVISYSCQQKKCSPVKHYKYHYLILHLAA